MWWTYDITSYTPIPNFTLSYHIWKALKALQGAQKFVSIEELPRSESHWRTSILRGILTPSDWSEYNGITLHVSHAKLAILVKEMQRYSASFSEMIVDSFFLYFEGCWRQKYDNSNRGTRLFSNWRRYLSTVQHQTLSLTIRLEKRIFLL